MSLWEMLFHRTSTRARMHAPQVPIDDPVTEGYPFCRKASRKYKQVVMMTTTTFHFSLNATFIFKNALRISHQYCKVIMQSAFCLMCSQELRNTSMRLDGADTIDYCYEIVIVNMLEHEMCKLHREQ